MAKVISFINQKGGVGKTTSTLNVAAALKAAGKRVLAIDMDPQANLTRSVGLDPDRITHTIDNLLRKESKVEEVVQKSLLFDFIPSNIRLAATDVWMNNEMGKEFILKKSAMTSFQKYDYVLIDCPPALGNLSTNAMMASDYLVIVVKTDNFSRYGTADLMSRYKIAIEFNPELKILGVLANAYDGRRNLDRDVLEMFRERFEDPSAPGKTKVFETVIRNAVALTESPAKFKDIFSYAPESQSAEEFRKLAQEIVERVEGGEVRGQA